MMPLQNTKTVVVIKPQSLASSATATGIIDTLGFNEVAINALLDSAAAVTDNPAVLSVAEGDTSTAFTNVTGLVGDATDGFTIPNADTANPQVVRMNLDLRKRKRYLKVSVTPSTAGAQGVAIEATLGKAEDSTVAHDAMAETVDL